MEVDENGRRRDNDMNPEFPVQIERNEYDSPGLVFISHWHEQFQMIYILEGEAALFCNSARIKAVAGDIVAINCNDLHHGENVGKKLVYFQIKTDLQLLIGGRTDLRHRQYVVPLEQNRILFRNHISGDAELTGAITQMIREYEGAALGYELEVTGMMYRILALLLRKHTIRMCSVAEMERQRRINSSFQAVLDYMERNMAEIVSLEELAAVANLSPQHFCRAFRKATGKSPVSYLNWLRMNEADRLLRESGFNISQVAAVVGFSDSNYFSRMYRKYRKETPTETRNRGRG